MRIMIRDGDEGSSPAVPYSLFPIPCFLKEFSCVTISPQRFA